MRITDEQLQVACLAYGGSAFPGPMRRALEAYHATLTDHEKALAACRALVAFQALCNRDGVDADPAESSRLYDLALDTAREAVALAEAPKETPS